MKRVDYTVDLDSLRARMDRLKNMHGIPNPSVRILERNKDGAAKNPSPGNVPVSDDSKKPVSPASHPIDQNATAGAAKNPSPGNVPVSDFSKKPVSPDSHKIDQNVTEGVHNPTNVSGGSMGATADGKVADNAGNTASISYASAVKATVQPKKVNFRFMETNSEVEGVDILLPVASVIEVNSRFSNSLYGYFLGERLAFPVVETYVKNSWAKFGLKKVMMNSLGFFFFQFESRDGMMKVLEKGPWMIRSVPIFISEWTPNVSLTKQDRKSVPVWVKLYDVPLVAYSEDGLSMLASKLGRPILLDSYTSQVCLNSWGRHSYARALIEIDATRGFKDTLVVGIPNVHGEGFSKEEVKVEYEWKPPFCSHCHLFGHNDKSCPLQVKVSPEKENDDDFVTVTRKKGKSKGKQVEGIKLTKPKPQFVYRPKQPVSVSGLKEKLSDPKVVNAAGPSCSKVSSDVGVSTSNAFSVLESEGNDDGVDPGLKPHDTSGIHNSFSFAGNEASDDDDDEVIFDESETVLNTKTGASTPDSEVPHV